MELARSLLLSDMKIVHISFSDLGGGAAKAAYAIHSDLKNRGIDSVMLVAEKLSADNSVKSIFRSATEKNVYKILWLLEKILIRFGGKIRGGVFSLNVFAKWKPLEHPEIETADIVCLYWVGNGLLTAKQISQFRAPIVWRLSDAWAMTGGCHYPNGCEKYVEQCISCPQAKSAWFLDLPKMLFHEKINFPVPRNIMIVTPTQWIASLARKSKILSGRQVEVVPTGVDEHEFCLRDQGGRESGQTILLIGANNIMADERKGWQFIPALFKALGEKARDFQLVVFGVESQTELDQKFVMDYGVKVFGKIKEKSKLVELYQSGSIFLCPSLEDNLPNTVLEAMSCGLPVLAFDIPGLSDILIHKENAFLARAFDVDELALGLSWLVKEEHLKQCSIQARQTIVQKFTRKNQMNKMIELYQGLLKCVG